MKQKRIGLSLVHSTMLIIILLAGDVRTSGKVLIGSRHRCTIIIVGKDATLDGSVLLGHNEDWGKYTMPLRWNPRKKHEPGTTLTLQDGQVIAQVEQTYSNALGLQAFIAAQELADTLRTEYFQ
jgi:hypothetical protein